MTSGGRVYAWCGCRDPRTGRRLGAACPRRGEPGHGSWYVSLELPALPGAGRRRIRRGGFGSEQAARAALAQLQMPAVGAGGPGGPPVTTGQWLARWLETRTRPRYSTMRNYRAHARLYLTPCLGQILLADLTPAHVQAMLTAVALRRAAEGRPVGAGTLARIRATLRAALNAAIRAGHLADNPASKAELPAVPRARPVVWTSARIAEWQRTGVRPAVAVWTPAQTAAFLNAARGERLYAAFHVIALRGLRRGEAAGLRWCDLDLDNGTAVIAQQLQQYDGQIAAGPVKTASSQRAVALDQATVVVLRRHQAAQEDERRAAGSRYRESGYVFTDCYGDPVAPDSITGRFKRLASAAGLPPVRLHDLRHVAASIALAAGAELKTVQDQLGHSSIVLTADTYISVLPEVARKAAEDSAALVAAAGYRVPGTRRPPRKAALRGRPASAGRVGPAHPARQIGRPRVVGDR